MLYSVLKQKEKKTVWCRLRLGNIFVMEAKLKTSKLMQTINFGFEGKSKM